MIQRIKNFFVPEDTVNDVPGVLTPTAFLILLVLGCGLVLSPLYLRENQFATISGGVGFDKGQVIALVNQARSQSNLPALKENPVLDQSAQAKAQDMIQNQYFAHHSPQKKSPWDFFREKNYRYTAAGENLALDFVTADDAHRALMASPTHRANILNKLYTEVGVSVEQGYFEGRQSIFVVQHFGKPRQITVGRVSTPTPTTTSAPAATSTVGQAPQTLPNLTLTRPQRSLLVLGVSDIPGNDLSVRLIQLLAGIIFLGIITGLSFTLLRRRRLGMAPALRALVLLALFGYIAVVGVAQASPQRITEVPEATIVLEEAE